MTGQPLPYSGPRSGTRPLTLHPVTGACPLWGKSQARKCPPDRPDGGQFARGDRAETPVGAPVRNPGSPRPRAPGQAGNGYG